MTSIDLNSKARFNKPTPPNNFHPEIMKLIVAICAASLINVLIILATNNEIDSSAINDLNQAVLNFDILLNTAVFLSLSLLYLSKLLLDKIGDSELKDKLETLQSKSQEIVSSFSYKQGLSYKYSDIPFLVTFAQYKLYIRTFLFSFVIPLLIQLNIGEESRQIDVAFAQSVLTTIHSVLCVFIFFDYKDLGTLIKKEPPSSGA